MKFFYILFRNLMFNSSWVLNALRLESLQKNGHTGEGVIRLLIFDMISSPGVPQSVRDVMESAILKN